MPSHSTPTAPARKAYRRPNDYRIDGDCAYITLTDPQGNVTGEAILDRDDLPRAIAYGRWHKQIVRSKNAVFEYVVCYIRKDSPDYTKRGRRQFLHRLVMDAPPDLQVDHWDGNCLDCRKKNLRVVDASGNSLNRFFHRRIARLEAALVEERARYIKAAERGYWTMETASDAAREELVREGLLRESA